MEYVEDANADASAPAPEPRQPFMPTSTCGKVFYLLPGPGESVGRLVGPTAVSSMDTDQSGMRIVCYATYVSAPPCTHV